MGACAPLGAGRDPGEPHYLTTSPAAAYRAIVPVGRIEQFRTTVADVTVSNVLCVDFRPGRLILGRHRDRSETTERQTCELE
jgi:hypothetical protein